MHPLTMTSGGGGAVNNSKRRKSSSRRFTVKDMKKKEIIPFSHNNNNNINNNNLLPTTNATMMPRKQKQHHHFQNIIKKKKTVRMLSFVAFFFIVMSLFNYWSTSHSKLQTIDPLNNQASNNQQLIHNLMSPNTNNNNNNEDQTQQLHQSEQQKQTSTETNDHEKSNEVNINNNHDQQDQSSQQQQQQQQLKEVEEEKPIILPIEQNVPERLEWYTRTDFKDGQRPICRITHPLVLSNGTILLPDWMEKHEQLLKKCNIGKHSYYTPEVPPVSILSKINDLDYDLSLTIPLNKLQEPTHELPIYLTEHVLKASYLFQVFSGFANKMEPDTLNEKRCIALANGTDCNSEIKRPVLNSIKPALFIPKKIQTDPNSNKWIYEMLTMVNNAYAAAAAPPPNENDQDQNATENLLKMNISSVVTVAHKNKKEELIGTKFRSLLAMDGMFRHLPQNGLKSSRLFSTLNHIQKEPRTFKDTTDENKCKLTIGIASSKINNGDNNNEDMTFKKADGLMNNLNMMTKFALPTSEINIKVIDISENKHMKDITNTLDGIDMLIAPSGNELNSIGFLRPSSFVLELMPFGIKPIIHKAFAKLLGLKYQYLRGRPQDDAFKTCIQHEAGKNHGGPPEWEAPLTKAWDSAIAEFTLTGSSKFDVLKAEHAIRNYQSRICASKQPVDVRLEEAARKVLHNIKDMCGMSDKKTEHEHQQ